MTITRICLKASDIISLVQRITAEDGFVSEEQFSMGLQRLEVTGVEGIPADMLIAHIKRVKDKRGYISQIKFREWLREIACVQIEDMTAFDLLDAKYQDPSWPPTGRWDDNSKHVTEVASEDIEGV